MMEIICNNLNSSNRVALSVDPYETINNIKQKIRDKEGYNITYCDLILVGGSYNQLEDENTLSDYGIKNNNVIHLVTLLKEQPHESDDSDDSDEFSEEIQIQLKFHMDNSIGRDITMHIQNSDYVESLKETIQELHGYPLEQQRLIYQGRVLEAGQRFSAYNIQNRSTIHVLLRMRGG